MRLTFDHTRPMEKEAQHESLQIEVIMKRDAMYKNVQLNLENIFQSTTHSTPQIFFNPVELARDAHSSYDPSACLDDRSHSRHSCHSRAPCNERFSSRESASCNGV